MSTQDPPGTPLPAGRAGPPAPAAIGPVPAAERIAVVDILRGLAILGIFVVNMQAFNAPLLLPYVEPQHWPGAVDRAVQTLIVLLAQGKFYTMFSFVFGLGLALQMQRVEAHGGRFAPLYARRLLLLLGIGLAHAFLIWMGDILVTYALFGFALLLFRKRSDRALGPWIGVFLLIPVLVGTIGALGTRIGWIPLDAEKQAAVMRKAVEESLRVYPAGSFAEIMARRAKDVLFVWATIPFFGTHVLAMFLLGLWVGRRRLLERVAEHLPHLRRVQRWGLALGLAGSAVVAATFRNLNPMLPSFAAVGTTACFLVGSTALSLFYMSSVVLLAQRDEWRRRLAPLADVGRLALSNYLLQSVVATLIFYSYGLGLYGKMGPAAGLLLVAAIYALQVALSAAWLRLFRFGPAEWAWRSLTYGRPQPMRA